MNYNVNILLIYYKSLAELLRAMRLCHISPDYLAENIEPHHLVRENPSAHEIVIDMMKLHLTKKLNPRQEASRKSTLGIIFFRETTTILANFLFFQKKTLI